MKFLSLVFCVYFLSLSVMACTDTPPSPDTNFDNVSAVDFANDHSHEQEEGDNCSPFCICCCCHTHPIPVNQIRLFHPSKVEITYVQSNPEFVNSEIEELRRPPRS